jgi:hypothetical protein
MDMWTWSAGEHCSGVTGSADRAKGYVRDNLAVGDTARIERVRAELSFRTMSSFYLATGSGWTGTRNSRGITWTALFEGPQS